MTGESSAPPTYLVAGGARVDAGKTTFSAGLVAHLAERAGDAVGVKPRAGNDYWFDHDDYRVATDAGRLYGKDARTLAAATTRALPTVDDESPSPSAVTPESINPVHRLWKPTPGRTGMLGDADRTFLCDRVTTESGTRFVVNGAAEDAGLLPEELAERLPLADATRVNDVPEFNEVMAESHLPAIERLAERVARTPVPRVVESYADVAGTLPRDGPVAPDAVAVVDPGRARIYAGDRYAKARAVAAGSPREGAREEHVDAVTEMIEPLATEPLPALSGDVRGDPDRVAAAYEPAYAALTDAVEN
ncbi:ATPase [Halorubrum sp. Atlit-26R]|uniref:ATPase n=1 Tax=Halorubrum sp. Atlit-26R TaxID=2282128 RepID=UPI000EF21A41|nr:ATPase [Halorubrum sp. Atlit-26R]RLM67747.1 ATPase [Halorubrum sp. Atlit-26R]